MNRTKPGLAAIAGALLAASGPACGQGLNDLLKALPLPQGTSGGAADAVAGALSNDEIIGGLKEALAKGTTKAVKRLGRTDGFLGNARVKIPIPEKLQVAESALRSFGQGKYADELIETMNRAAESAVPEAAEIFGDAIRKMSIEDARKILNGPNNAATEYFRKVGSKRLHRAFLPIVENATDANGVTRAVKQVTDKATLVTSALGQDDLDVDEYVTDKAMDGLFKMIAAEEKRIRSNPAARTTDLLKKVFGAAGG